MARNHKSSPAIRFRELPVSKIPKVIPPRSVVILASIDERRTPDWHIDRGRMFRIGYYNRADGMDCLWLVNDAGEYEQTIDRKTLLKHFVILKLSDERDIYGDSRPGLKPLRISNRPAFTIPALLAS